MTGIFTAPVHGLAGGPREGVASVGVRPTVRENGRPIAEVYLLDFDAPIYGRRITIEFLHKLRDEARFADLPALTRQIARDVDDARGYFSRAPDPRNRSEPRCPTTPAATTSRR